MDVFKLKDLSKEERRFVFDSESVDCKKEVYMKPLSDDELAVEKDKLAQLAIKRALLDDEFKRMKSDFKAKSQPVNDEFKLVLQSVKSRAVEIEGDVYSLADFETQMIHKVDIEGNVIQSRRMLPEERQYRITTLLKTNQS